MTSDIEWNLSASFMRKNKKQFDDIFKRYEPKPIKTYEENGKTVRVFEPRRASAPNISTEIIWN